MSDVPSPSPAEAERFAREWIAAWNEHDIERIMAHYADEIELTSPFVLHLLGEPDGTIRGKGALADYFRRGLEAFPDLLFELRAALPGIGSVVIVYRSVRDLIAAEVMELDPQGRIARARAHYRPA